ncbi:hypothetical protein Tco_0676484 [Tanacetum coccineum]
MSHLFSSEALAVHNDVSTLCSEQLDEFNLEEMDLKWQVAMISMRLKKFYKKTGRRLASLIENAFQKKIKNPQKAERIRSRDVGNTRYRAKDNRRRLGKQEEPKALVTLDGEGVDWTGHVEDEQENFSLMAYSNSGSNTKGTIGDASIEIPPNSLSSFKKVSMSKRDKSGLRYGDQVHNGVLSYENEVLQSVFDSRVTSDVEDRNLIGSYMISMFTYGPKQSKTSESDTQTSNYDSCESNSSTETLESVPEPVVVEPKVVSQPKVWPDAPIIEEYEF